MNRYDVNISARRAWPDVVRLKQVGIGGKARDYVPKLTARAVVSFGPHDTEYHTTGHCECSLCSWPIDQWDRFCRHCGAEIIARGA